MRLLTLEEMLLVGAAGSKGGCGSGKGGGKGSSKKWPKKGNPNAIAAAIHRHEQNLETEYYALLAASLRDAGFTEREVRRGLTIQRAKNKKKRAHGLPMNFAQ